MKYCCSALALGMLVSCVLLGCGDRDAAETLPIASSSKPRFSPETITLKEVKDSDLKELFDERLVFVDASGTEWVAPKGTRTDGASVPRLALPLTDGRFDRTFLTAAAIHDAYCQSDNETVSPNQYRSRGWRAVHRMFFEASIAGGASQETALLMFAAVWLGGPRWDDPEHSLDAVPVERLNAEYEACKEWIEREHPTVEEVEAWMDRREEALRAPR